MSSLIRYTSSGEWSALYVDGKLDRVSDHYLIDERIAQLAGVEERQSDDFLRGGDQRPDVADTVEQAEEYATEREARNAEAAKLRQQATELLAQAEELED